MSTPIESLESRFRDLLETIPDAVVMANAAGRVVLSNSHAETLFGYMPGELNGAQVESLLPERYRRGHVGFRHAYSESPRPRAMGQGLELFGLRKDGQEFPVEISLGPIDTEEGPMVISAIRDISERKQIQLDLHQKNIELQNAAEAKNRFLANMSHELRTPLNGVIGFADFLVGEKPGPLNEKQKEYLTDILHSGRHLLQLINDVLDLAKVEAGKMEVHPKRFNPNKAIEEVCAVVRPLSQRKSIHMRLEVSPHLADVVQDESKFKQVFYNLVANAVKFTDERGEIAITGQPVERGFFEIAVSDTGIGIKSADLERLFKEFEQLDSSASRRFEGTGLGLALTKQIVELLGGSIRVESEEGLGSTFTVCLPQKLEGSAS